MCRKVDDIADEGTSSSKSFKQLTHVIESIEAKDITNEYVEHLMSITPIVDAEIFTHLLLGVRSDTQPVAISNEKELLQYCYQVAGTVGLMMCNVLKVEDPRALAHAIDLGIAMQLTNIARDVSDDAKIERRYLPATWVNSCKPAEILSPSKEQVILIQTAVERLLVLAEKYYASGFIGLPFLSFRVRFVVLVAGRVYRRIGAKVRKSRFNVWGGRIYTTKMEKLIELIVSSFICSATPSIRCYKTGHNSTLHEALRGYPGANTEG
ncbi:MAG: phytoene synthase [Rhodospirillaceae bacterium]|nr:phytoene synthase [Rhodospirillaceae bacterium]